MTKKKGKISIKRVSIAVLSLVMIVGFVMLFMAASEDKETGHCKGLVLSLDKKVKELYIDTAAIRERIMTKDSLNPVGRSMEQLKIPFIKQEVESQDWVKSAEVYLGNHQLLNVRLKQQTPIARVFRRNGQSFYLTHSGQEIKSAGKAVVDLPVFTGFSNGGRTEKDSIFLIQMQKMSKFIAGNIFWQAQVEQININNKREFELIPQVGDALILFGEGKYIARKFKKLRTFYKKGLNNIGWGYYDTLDLRFEDQVVATRKDKKGNPIVNALKRNNDPDSKILLTEQSENNQEIINNEYN